jgi:hypothetical protein
MADTLVDDYDIVDLLSGLADRCVDLAEAFSRLLGYARNSNLRLTDVAEAAVDGTLNPLAWAQPAPSWPPPGDQASSESSSAGTGGSASGLRDREFPHDVAWALPAPARQLWRTARPGTGGAWSGRRRPRPRAAA